MLQFECWALWITRGRHHALVSSTSGKDMQSHRVLHRFDMLQSRYCGEAFRSLQVSVGSRTERAADERTQHTPTATLRPRPRHAPGSLPHTSRTQVSTLWNGYKCVPLDQCHYLKEAPPDSCPRTSRSQEPQCLRCVGIGLRCSGCSEPRCSPFEQFCTQETIHFTLFPIVFCSTSVLQRVSGISLLDNHRAEHVAIL
jgi:hypothetical protein